MLYFNCYKNILLSCKRLKRAYELLIDLEDHLPPGFHNQNRRRENLEKLIGVKEQIREIKNIIENYAY